MRPKLFVGLVMTLTLGVSNALAQEWVTEVKPKVLTPAPTFDSEVVAAVIDGKRTQFLECNQRNGSVKIRFTIDKDGAVASAKAKGVSESVNRCIEKVMLRTKFASAETSIVATYSLQFTRTKQSLPAEQPAAAVRSPSGHGSGDTSFSPGRKRNGPLLLIGTPKINGRYPAEIVRRFIKHDSVKYVSCYQKALEENPKQKGAMELAFSVNDDGSTFDVVATGFDTNVANCVKTALTTLQLPQLEPDRGGGAFTATLSVTFKPN
jgi:hypothetical protein